jgi:hypothetical protein
MVSESIGQIVAVAGKRLKFRTKFAKMGSKVIVIVPKSYHKDAESFEDEYIDVEISEVSN